MRRIDRGDGITLAYQLHEGRGPTTVFLPGFRGDMAGEKASALATFCAAERRAMLRFDYSGHGASGGAFEDGTISRWRDDALCLLDRVTEGPLILVGSSMGGWIALLLALARPERVAGLIGINAAADFTEALMWEAMAPRERDTLLREGRLHVASEYGGHDVTRALIEDGRRHLLLGSEIAISCPVRLLQGRSDTVVPWETALRIADRLVSPDVQITLVQGGDHRLSRPSDIALLRTTLAALFGEDGA